jgi:hypothetical protein
MPRFSRSLVVLLAAVAVLSGCSHRLKGPLHTADGPAWVAPAAPSGAAPLEVEYRVLLIGDAGYFLEDDPTLAALDLWATQGTPSSVIFLGDNIYNEGLTDEDREHGEKVLSQLLGATAAPKFVIPGNHDWGLLPKNYNLKSIQNQQAFVDEWPAGDAEFLPKDGCMGPALRVLRPATPGRPAVVLIALDPTPWIQPRVRDLCADAVTAEAHLAELEALLAEHAADHVLVASHYPMLTGGPHGGLTYGFPADAIVSTLGWIMGGLMNTYEPGYADWIERTETVFRKYPPTLYAAGHDHNLQLLDAGDAAGLYVVSGAGARARVSTVTHLDETIFAHAAEGFVVVDFGRRGDEDAVVVRVVEPLVSIDEPVYLYDLKRD